MTATPDLHRQHAMPVSSDALCFALNNALLLILAALST